MDERGKAQIQAIAAGLLGFGLVVGAGSYFVIPHGLAAPASTAVSGTLFAPAPLPAPDATVSRAQDIEGVPPASAGSPAPLLSAEFRPDANASSPASSPGSSAGVSAVAGVAASAVVASAVVSRSGGAAAPRLIATAPLGAEDDAASSAGVAVAPSRAKAATVVAARSSSRSAVVANATAATAFVHYGVSDRSQLMERGAGPVYNFGALGAKTDPIAGAMQQVMAAQQNVGGSAVDSADKAALQQNAVLFQQAASQADAAVRQATVQAGAPAAPTH